VLKQASYNYQLKAIEPPIFMLY